MTQKTARTEAHTGVEGRRSHVGDALDNTVGMSDGDSGGAAELERSSSSEDAVHRGGAAVTSSRGWVPED